MTKIPRPSRGELWNLRFDPAVGAEIRKVRPAVVLSRDSIGRLPLRIIVPITDWKPGDAGDPWFVHLPAVAGNGLSKEAGADAFRVKSVSIDRFVTRLGTLTDPKPDEIAAAVALCVRAP